MTVGLDATPSCWWPSQRRSDPRFPAGASGFPADRKARGRNHERAAMPGNAEEGALRAYCAEQGSRSASCFDRAAAETYAKGRLIAATSPEWRARFESLRDAVLTFAEGACHA
ncbi:MAG: hypothetical protein ACLT2T_04105 [Bilophila wadsworthia]